MGTQLYNRLRAVVDNHGHNQALARELCDVVGDEIAAAKQDALSGHLEDPPPKLLGMTEPEAAVCWCPLVREVTPVGKGAKDVAIGNRYIDKNGSEYANPAGCACIASNCMFRRWDSPTRGHCGLAGPVTYQPLGESRRRVSRNRWTARRRARSRFV